MKIQATHLANLFSYATYKGIAESDLRNLLLDKKLDVCHPKNYISNKEFLSVVNYIIDKTSDKCFGINFGCYHNIKALGFIAQLSLSTTSIEQAVLVLQNYLENSFSLVSLHTHNLKDEYIIELKSSINNKELRSQILDMVFSFIYRELKLMLPDSERLIIEIGSKKSKEFAMQLNAIVKTSERYAFVFDNKILTTTINEKRAKEISILLPQFLKMLDKKKVGYKGFSMQVRNMILNMCSPELPSFHQVADQFPLSHRTLQRKLTDEGVSFRKISDDVKQELANYLSKGKGIQTQEIAHLLGYSGASAYLHAVSKWNHHKFRK